MLGCCKFTYNLSLNHLIYLNYHNFSGTNSSAALPGMDAVDKARAMRQELLARIERLGGRLPPNTLDELIDQLGGPDGVAEVSSRI